MRKFKQLMAVLCAVTIGFSAYYVEVEPQVVYGKTLSQLQAEQKEIKRKQEEAKTALANAKTNQEKVQAEITSLDAELNTAQNELEIVQTQLADTEAKLAKSQDELENATKEKEDQAEAFSKRVRYIYENGSIGYLKVLFESTSFGDFLTRLQYVNDIMVYDEKTLERLRAVEGVIQVKTEDIANEKMEIEILVADQEIKYASLETKKDEKQALYNKYLQDEQNYEQVLQSTEEASNNVQKLINQAAAAAAAAVAKNSSGNSGNSGQTVYYTGGSLQWPVPSRSYISSGYGYRKRPIGSGTEFHTGYDIPASYGANVVAAEAGTVISAGYMNGYGYTVILSHGNGLTTLYGHNSSLSVSVGQTVSRGQTIAKIGSTGNSTGNHLHFEVRVNGSHVSPKSYLGV